MRKITITIKPDEVNYDIAQNLFQIGESMTDVDAKNRFLTQGGMLEKNSHLIKREVDKAWNDVLQALSAYSTAPTTTVQAIQAETSTEETVSDELSEQGNESGQNWVGVFYFPQNTLANLGETLMHHIHEFLVAMGTFLWLRRTTPKASEIFGEEAKAALQSITITASNRIVPERIKGYGF